MNRRIVLVLILLGLFTGSYLLLKTTPGLTVLLRLVPGLTDGVTASGSIYSGFTLNNIRYETTEYRIEADQATLAWHPWPLLLNHLDIEAITIDGLRIVLLPGERATSPRRALRFPALPIDITLGKLQSNGLQITSGADKEVVSFDQINFQARTDQQTLFIEQVSVIGTGYQLDGEGQLELDEQLQHHLALDGTYADTTEIVGTLDLSGDINATRLNVTLGSPWQATSTITITDPAGNLAWTSTTLIPVFNPALYADSAPAQPLAIQMQANGTKSTARAEGTVRLAEVGGTPAGTANSRFILEELEARFEVQLPRLDAALSEASASLYWQQIRLRSKDSDGSVLLTVGESRFEYGDKQVLFISRSGFNLNNQTSGQWDARGTASREVILVDTLALDLEQGRLTGQLRLDNPGPTASMNANLHWDLLNLVQPPGQTLQLRDGAIELAGTPQNYSINLHTGIAREQLPLLTLAIIGTANTQSGVIDSFRLQSPIGDINGTGTVDWSNAIQASLQFNGTGLDPGNYWPEWPGTLAITGETPLLRESP